MGRDGLGTLLDPCLDGMKTRARFLNKRRLNHEKTEESESKAGILRNEEITLTNKYTTILRPSFQTTKHTVACCEDTARLTFLLQAGLSLVMVTSYMTVVDALVCQMTRTSI